MVGVHRLLEKITCFGAHQGDRRMTCPKLKMKILTVPLHFPLLRMRRNETVRGDCAMKMTEVKKAWVAYLHFSHIIPILYSFYQEDIDCVVDANKK